MAEPPESLLKGIAVSPGIVHGPAFVIDDEASLSVVRREIGATDVAVELKRFDAALADVEKALQRLRDDVQEKVGSREAEIFEAQIAMLRDPMFYDDVVATVRDDLRNIEAAVAETIQRFSRMLSEIEDPLLRERAADVRDVGRRVFDRLVEESASELVAIPQGVILVAPELAPSTTVRLDLKGVRAVVTERGGKTSHAAILMRSLGIPAVVGVRDATRVIRTGDSVILDGISGSVFVGPSAAVKAEYARLEADLEKSTDALHAFIDRPATTADGEHIHILANIGKTADITAALRYGAEGVGLFRTEFSFLIRDHYPTADEHLEIYTNLAEQIRPREVVVRVLDIGSDKTPCYFDLTPEPNPSLGLRGTRLLLNRPEVLEAQLRAILQASGNHRISVLFPGIAGVEEIRGARAVLERTKEQLAAEGVPFDPAIRVGAMIELPSAALRMGPILREVDFVSLGTNDLTQYILAADRGSPEMGRYYRAIHPAVLQTIWTAIQAAREAGKEVTVCGAMAGSPERVALLIGFGARKLSIAPADILEVKRMLSGFTVAEAESLAREVLAMDTVAEIEQRLEAFNREARARVRGEKREARA